MVKIIYRMNGVEISKESVDWYFTKEFVDSCTAKAAEGHEKTEQEVFNFWQDGTGDLTIEVRRGMVLSKFYPLLRSHAEITLKRGNETLYHGPLNSIPDEGDALTVKDFKGTDTGFIFYVE